MSQDELAPEIPGPGADLGSARRIRVAVVTETYPPEINGVARTVGAMVDWLLARGHAVELVRPRQRREPVRAPHPALRETLTLGAAIPQWQVQVGFSLPGRLAARWRSVRPDLVHVVTEGPLGWAAVSAASALDIPLSSDFHTNFHSYSEHYGFAWMRGTVAGYLRRLHNRTACTLVPTEQLKSELGQLGFERLRIAGRGVDAALFNPTRRSTELRRQWGCLNDERVVISVGRVAPEKGLDLFAGMRVGEDLAAHYASADLFLFPSVTETFGNVVLEAMASGLAVLAYDDAAARQHIVHRVSGLLAPRGNAQLFTHLAELLARDPALRRSLGHEARRVSEGLPWERKFPELEAALLETASSSAPGEARDGPLASETTP